MNMKMLRNCLLKKTVFVGFGLIISLVMTVIHLTNNTPSKEKKDQPLKLENMMEIEENIEEWIVSLEKLYNENKETFTKSSSTIASSKRIKILSTVESIKQSHSIDIVNNALAKRAAFIDSSNILKKKTPPGEIVDKKSITTQRNATSETSSIIAVKRRNLKYSKSTPGVLNVHIWEGWCGSRIEDLKRNAHFPLFPSIRSNVTHFFTQWYETGFGERVFGYIHPPETGNYTFAVSCDDNCEIWLSNDTSPVNIRMIASVGTFHDPANTRVADFKLFRSQISKPIYLMGGKKYFIEGLHKQAAFKDHMLLTWLAPSWPKIKTIGARYISSYIDITLDDTDVTDYENYIPTNKAHILDPLVSINSLYFYNRTKFKFATKEIYNETYPINYINEKDLVDVLPQLFYKPSYVLDFIPKRYEGIKLVHETAVYPDDYTELTHMFIYEDCYENRQFDSHKNLLRSYPTFKLPKFVSPTVDTSFDTKYKFIFKNFVRKNNTDRRRQAIESVRDIKHRNHLKNQLLFDLYNQKQHSLESNFRKRSLLSFDETKVDKQHFEILKNINNLNEKVLPKTTMKTELTSPIILKKSNNNRPMFVPHTKSFIKSAFYSDYSISHRARQNSLSDTRIPEKIDKKIFFKDGASQNVSLTNNFQMIRLYDIFGPAIYYLSQSKQRGLLWRYKMSRSTCKTDGNLILSEKVAVGIVSKYMKSLEKAHPNKYSLKEIINIEENHDILYGDRYLVELDLIEKKSGKIFRLSRFIYRDIETNKLYEPKDFQWNPYARVHVIVPVKNQGRWVQHFIENMERIYEETKDENMNVILVDFNSSDINITKNLMRSSLKNYDVITLDGPFQRTVALQAGLDKVKDENDIIFTCDLHLVIPSLLINTIRKHTIKGKMAFAPMVHRLHCGYTPSLPYGLWEIEGFGLFSISKYDFDRVGGMNTKEFKTKWGGEDWELVDRTLAHGIEVERLRIPHFHHYYHSKKRMWTSTKQSPGHLYLDYDTS